MKERGWGERCLEVPDPAEPGLSGKKVTTRAIISAYTLRVAPTPSPSPAAAGEGRK